MPEYPEIKNEETAAEQSVQPNPFLPGYKPHIPEKKEHKPLNKIEKIFIAVFFILSFLILLCSTVFISALLWLTFCCLQGQPFFYGTKKKDRLFSLCCAELFRLREA